MKVSARRYPNGFAVFVGRHRWDYWGRATWLPLSVRNAVHWWGYLTHQKCTDPEENGRG